MRDNDIDCLCEALKSVPPQWRDDVARFVDRGEASDQFMVFLSQDLNCRRACEMILRADHAVQTLFKFAGSDCDLD